MKRKLIDQLDKKTLIDLCDKNNVTLTRDLKMSLNKLRDYVEANLTYNQLTTNLKN